MVKRIMFQKIQLLKRQGMIKTDIAGELNLNIKTVTKYYDMTESDYNDYKQSALSKDKTFECYKDDIKEVYKINDNKRLNMTAVYDYLEEKYKKLEGSERSLRNYINHLIRTGELKIVENVRVYSKTPELPYGKQMQLDFGENKCMSGLKLYIFAAVLSGSRYKYVVYQDKPFKTIDVILHLLNCFDFFGGIPEELVIDQDKILVVSENKGDIIYTKDFKYFLEEMDLRMYVCRKADPETKGRVENLVGYNKDNFLSTRDFTTVDEANKGVVKWLKRRANGKISQATKKIPAEEIENERIELKPIRSSIFRKDLSIGREARTASEKSLISVQACQYLLPPKYRNKDVEVYITEKKLFVFDVFSGIQIVEYDLSLIPGEIIKNRNFLRDTEKKSSELKKNVLEMFDLKNWQIFVEENYKRFPRYVRDQCGEAKKYFENKKIYEAILDKALEYCIKNKTQSFSNLNDTYKYYEKMYEESKDFIDVNSPEIKKITTKYEPVRVKRRNFAVYKSILKRKEANDESIRRYN